MQKRLMHHCSKNNFPEYQNLLIPQKGFALLKFQKSNKLNYRNSEQALPKGTSFT
jgi:hypothetical protein